MVRGGLELCGGAFHLPRRAGSQLARRLGLLRGVTQLLRQLFHQIHGICAILHHRGQVVNEPGDPGRQAVDLPYVVVGPVGGSIREVPNGVLGLARPLGERLHPLRELIRGAPEIRLGLIDEIMEDIQLIQQLPRPSLVVEQTHFRLQLSGNAAHVLPTQNGAGVGATVQIPGLPPGDAADVVAHMGIAHRAGVDAALQDSRGEAGDAADVGAGRHIFRRVELLRIEVLQAHLRVHLGGVDAAAVLALDDAAQILSGDAAHIVFSCDRAGKGAVDDLALGLVDARQAADGVCAADLPRKAAVTHRSPVAAGQAADGVLPVGGSSAAFHGQVLHHAGGLDVTEQPPHIAAAGDGHAGDGVSLAFKGAAKGGDGSEFPLL